MALKVREVSERPFSGTVYSLSVDVDESYHTGNFVVHNCGSMNQGIAAGCLVMATPKDALPSLYGNTAYWMPDEGESAQAHQDYFKWLAKRIVEALHGELPDQKGILTRATAAADKYTWTRAALEMEKACNGEGWTTP